MSETIQAKPKYLQLRDRLLTDISVGVYGEGAALPSIKQIMAAHDVAQGTAVKAIEALASEGVVDRRAGVGVFVRRKGGPAHGLSLQLYEICRLVFHDAVHLSPAVAGCRLLDPVGMSPDADALTVTPLRVTDLARRGQVIPLNRFLDDDPALAASLDRNCKVFIRDGVHYALPVYQAPLCLHANLDLFASARVSPPKAPAGIDEIEKAGVRLRQRGVARPLVWPGWLSPLSALLGGVFEPGSARPLLDTPDALSRFERLRRLSMAAGEPDGDSDLSLLDDFCDGRSAMLLWGALPRAAEVSFRRAILPVAASGTPCAVFAEGLAITSTCRRPDLAWQVVRELAVECAPPRLIERHIPFPCTMRGALDFVAAHPETAAAYRQLERPLLTHLALGRRRHDIVRKALGAWWRPETDLCSALRHAQAVIDAVMLSESAGDSEWALPA